MRRSVLPAHAADAASAVLRRSHAVVLVDGRSGAGKSVFAAALARSAGAALLRLDDVYPGWDGLDAGADAAVRALRARRAGVAPTLAAWDWRRGRPAAALRLPLHGPLVVEGCGSLRPASRRLADLAVWLQLDPVGRQHRAMARDGDTYRPHWDRWARQEARAIERDRPTALADLVVDARGTVAG